MFGHSLLLSCSFLSFTEILHTLPIFLASLGSEMSLNIMLFCLKCWRKVLMDVRDVSLILSDTNPSKMFSNNS